MRGWLGKGFYGVQRVGDYCGVGVRDSSVAECLRRLKAQASRVCLPVLLAAPVAVHIAIRSDIHDDVVSVKAASKTAQQLVASRARAERHVDHLVAQGGRPGAGQLIEVAKGQIGDGIKQCGGNFGVRMGGPQQIDCIDRRGGDGNILASPGLEILARFERVLIDIDVARKRWRKRFGCGLFIPSASGRLGAGGSDFFSKIANLGVDGSFEAADLALQRADAGNLADASGDSQEQRIARHVKGARSKVALIRFRLHIVRARKFFGNVRQNRLVNLMVRVEQFLCAAGISGGRSAG